MPLYKKLGSLFTTTEEVSATTRLRRELMGIMASAHIPAAVSDNEHGIVAKMDQPVGMTAVAPIWEGVNMQRDPATEAASGKVQVTAAMFTDFRIIRASAYQRTNLHLA